MPLPNLIALTGYKGSGKSTAAQHLARTHGYRRLAFAQPLKDMLIAMGLTQEQVYGNKKEIPASILGSRTPRHAMQTLGTEWGRDMIDKNLWVNAVERRLIGDVPTVIDDLRFPNEAEMVRRRKGIIIFIARDGLQDVHPSETNIKDLPRDHTIINLEGLEELRKVTTDLLESL